MSIVNHPEKLPFPGDSIRDQTWSPIIGGHQQPLSSGHVNSPSQKGHVCRIARLGKMFQFFPSTKDQLMVTYWFGARCFGFRKDPPMKGIGILKLRAPEIHPKPPGPKTNGPQNHERWKESRSSPRLPNNTPKDEKSWNFLPLDWQTQSYGMNFSIMKTSPVWNAFSGTHGMCAFQF